MLLFKCMKRKSRRCQHCVFLLKEKNVTWHNMTDRWGTLNSVCACVCLYVFLKIRHREDVNMFLNNRVNAFLWSEDIHSHHQVSSLGEVSNTLLFFFHEELYLFWYQILIIMFAVLRVPHGRAFWFASERCQCSSPVQLWQAQEVKEAALWKQASVQNGLILTNIPSTFYQILFLMVNLSLFATHTGLHSCILL